MQQASFTADYSHASNNGSTARYPSVEMPQPSPWVPSHSTMPTAPTPPSEFYSTSQSLNGFDSNRYTPGYATYPSVPDTADWTNNNNNGYQNSAKWLVQGQVQGQGQGSVVYPTQSPSPHSSSHNPTIPETKNWNTVQPVSNSGYGYNSDASEPVVAYTGGSEPYGARGTGSASFWETSETSLKPSPSFNSHRQEKEAKPTPPPAPGTQRFGVKLLPESSARSSEAPRNVICQVGLDGLRLLDPRDGCTLRVYPLETITSWAVKESTIFTFWARSAVDVEQRAVRLQSTEYTTSNILDALTAACVQLFEMVGKDGQKASSTKDGESLPAGNKGSNGPLGFMEWMAAKAKAEQVEKDHWVPDEAAKKCADCKADFSAFNRRHHCRNCGGVFCDKCTKGRSPLTAEAGAVPVRVCDHCLAEVTHQLSNTRDKSSSTSFAPSTIPRSHEDLAKKLEEELNRKSEAKVFRKSARESSNVDQSTPLRRAEGSSVLTCTSCGSVAIVSNQNSACPTCGATTSGHVGNTVGIYPSISQAPPHLWSSRAGGPLARPATQQVVCPTCTVHLEVEVPESGTETVECGVCRHPFLVSA